VSRDGNDPGGAAAEDPSRGDGDAAASVAFAASGPSPPSAVESGASAPSASTALSARAASAARISSSSEQQLRSVITTTLHPDAPRHLDYRRETSSSCARMRGATRRSTSECASVDRLL